eukprot:TRINITY_DN2400_c1_g1_i1.p1 TRINITY_DN2400_c1_g1~~TRINITY_DN2400_c1_g1_i1.p1  ORF type:complete len:1380 (-),score=484.60 TRINITY_DN2400_c1_g1_i1:425-4564(-)
MASIEELKKLIKSHEIKIDDLEQDIQGEASKAKRKTMENDLKKMKADEKYVKAVEKVKELEVEAKKAAERAGPAATAKASAADKKAAKAKAKPETAPKVDAKADEATFAEIDAAFAASGKDAADQKATAIATMDALASATPFVLPRLEKLIPLFDNSKLAGPAVKAALAIVEGITPKGHGVADMVMPALLAGMEDKKWKVKVGCIQVLLPTLKQMEVATPMQLSKFLPPIVSKLAEAALEVRAEIRNATAAVLKEIGALVASPEIKALSTDLVTALAEPTNQKHTQAVLAKMGNATFKSSIDQASLSLLLPIVTRGLKDRESVSKKWSAQIFGSSSMLVKDTDALRPYLKTCVPLLQEALNDSVPEVQREGAKAFGILEQVLPDYSTEFNQPYLFGKLRGGDASEQVGAALGLAEVFVRMAPAKLQELIPEIQKGSFEEKWNVRRGFLELMDTMPQALKMEFCPYIERLFPGILLGITGDKDANLDPALKAGHALVGRFGDLCPELLMDGFEGAYAFALGKGDANKMQILREKNMQLLLKCAEKILEHKKFGQDMMTCEDCSTKETRERLLCLAFVARFDPDAAVKRVSSNVWKTCGGAPKMQKALAPTLEKYITKLLKGEMGAGFQKVAQKALEDVVKAGDMQAPSEEFGAVTEGFSFPDAASSSEKAQKIARGEKPDVNNGDDAANAEECGIHKVVEEHFNKVAAFGLLPGNAKVHIIKVTESVLKEGKKKRTPGARLVEDLVDCVTQSTISYKESAGDFLKDLSTTCEAIGRGILGADFDAAVYEGLDDDTLLRVEDMLLMYGAGKLLLRDTVLEMKKNRRYGIVGHNGAGKTTLMKEIVHGRIVGMPTHLKCVHVDDSKLGEMSKSSLSALEFVVKRAQEIGVMDAGAANLKKVGFDEKMFDVPVAELSTGWRMRLTLAVSMLKHADIVLLDEPTNHLDEESVSWLGEYLLTLTKSSVMVISHEPKFLNKVCTDIISYKDRRLCYTEGNFDAFIASKGIKGDDIEALLSGNLNLDEEEAKEGEEGEAAVKVNAPIAGPPKISFPIPGSVEGVKSSTKAVIEIKNLSFRYGKDKDYLFEGIGGKLSLGSRVAICGRNGCGKSTLMTLICSEMNASEGKDGSIGDVIRHCNLRVSYMKQDHLKTLGPFFDTSSLNYITQRFQNGYDEELQRRLIEPEDEEEAERRVRLAKEHGKYGKQVGTLLSRAKQGSQLYYEVQWEGLDDPKQNTMEPISKLRAMGLDKVVIACDERIAAKAAGLDQRPLTRREIVKHCEAFGIDDEMCCNQQIRGFSAGQKVRLSLAAMFWTKPHFIAVDEPTNYLDVETVDALSKALINFRGGILMIEPKTDFVEKVCNETWTMEDGKVTVAKLNNGVKRAA